MCCNRNNSNENVMGESGRRGCNFNCHCNCNCRCHWGNNVVAGDASRIALRGPGCISGTGQCDRFASNSVAAERGFSNFCGQVSPLGNTQVESERFIRRPCDCHCFNRCLYELLEDIFENSNGCPR